MRKLFILMAVVLPLISSCAKDEQKLQGEGVLRLGVNLEIPSTKAALSDAELLSTARVNIYYADFSGLVASYKYGSLPDKIYLPAAEYRVDVIAGEAVKDFPRTANFEQISYKGSTTFTVVGGKDETVQVEAKVNSTITKVNFDNTVSNNFNTGYKLTIGPDEENVVVYTAEKNGKPAYFLMTNVEEKKLFWNFSGVRTATGAVISKSGVINDVEPGKAYELNIRYTLKEGDADFNIYVDTKMTTIEEIVVFEPVSTGLAASASYEIWAGHASVHADVDESEFPDPSKIKFTYSSDGTNWTDKVAERTGEGTYLACLTGLTPSTEYTYKLKIEGEIIGEPMTFTTSDAPIVPNGDFEETTSAGKYYEFYNVNSLVPENRSIWWGSGNGASINGTSGSADMGFVICAPDTEVKYSGNQSACLSSAWALVKFAAGNLFSGTFAGLEGTDGGRVMFGRPFTGRPTALKVWVKYSAGKVNRISSYPAGETVTTNDYDRARIQFALGVWNPKVYGGDKTSPILVNTTKESTFVDYTNDPSTIAYNELILQSDASDSHNTWKEYTIKLNYKDEKTMPTHIIISCASSMLGDYFTGCDSSKLWVDKMELVYE